MTDELDDVQQLLDGMRIGDRTAVDQFFEKYGDLVRLVKSRLSQKLQVRLDADDIVQSACRSFFRRLDEGRFRFKETRELWGLLCAITMAKLNTAARFHGRAKRDVKREVHPPASNDGSRISFSPIDQQPSPADSVEADEFISQLNEAIEQLNEHEQQVVTLKMDDLSNTEIASKLECAEATIRYRLGRIRDKLQKRLEI